MPPNIFLGDLGIKEREQYGKNNWYDWSIANWGTKWNALSHNRQEDADKGTLVFYTAYNAPHPILKKLSEMFPEVTVHHQWADEDIGCNCGERAYKGGQILDEHYPDYGKRSVEFACEVMGTTPADHYLKLNEDGTDYVYDEEAEAMEVMKL